MASRDDNEAAEPDAAEIASVGREEFLGALSRLAGAVTLVTSRRGDSYCGMTATSFISVAAEPPMVLISVSDDSETAAGIDATGAYGVSLLTSDQHELSRQFALPANRDKFQSGQWREGVHGVPVLESGHATIECIVDGEFRAGDHLLYLGRVVATSLGEGSSPLVYHDRQYRRLDAGALGAPAPNLLELIGDAYGEWTA